MKPRMLSCLIALTAATVTLAAGTTAQGAPPPPVNYVALGDSIPAGWGVTADRAYPAILNESRRLVGANEAITGAATSAIADEIANFEADHPEGLDDVTRVTLTVGVNDISFPDFVSSCLQLPDCSELEGAIDHALEGLARRLPPVLAKIHGSFPNARVYVSGYYELFGSRNRVCQLTSELSITPVNMRFLNESARRLNDTIADAVAAARGADIPARFVNVESIFNGHGLCDSGRSWVIGFDDLNTATHPNRYGQAAYAAMFYAAGVR